MRAVGSAAAVAREEIRDGYEESPPDEQPQTLCPGTLDLGFGYPDGYDPVFSPHEMLIIQDRYLLQQLRLLNDERASEDSREEVLEWVAAPLVPGREAGRLGPLSFQRCCLEAHGADPATVQERVLRHIAPERLAELGYE